MLDLPVLPPLAPMLARLERELPPLATVDGRPDFSAPLGRLHPAASRVQRLSREAPATYIAFDLIAVDDEDLRTLPFLERRMRLHDVVGSATRRCS